MNKDDMSIHTHIRIIKAKFVHLTKYNIHLEFIENLKNYATCNYHQTCYANDNQIQIQDNMMSHFTIKNPKASFLLLCTVALGTMAAANDAPIVRQEFQAVNTPVATNILINPINRLPTPKIAIGKVQIQKTITIAQNKDSEQPRLDVTLLDDFIDDVSPNARHYPPNFPTRTSAYQTKKIISQLSEWIEPYAQSPNASFDVLLRAVKINSMARNLDLGAEFGVRANQYVSRALALSPNHPEANFLYGMMLAEGGGFNEGEKYLQKAANLGYIEAEQSLAQSDLLNDNRQGALARLQRLHKAHPNHPQLSTQIDIINNGGFYIWDIKDANINLNPVH